jgi:hypothetical protein
MKTHRKLPRILVIAGFAGMVIGAIDPIEGSLLILPGVGLLALGTFLGGSRHRALVLWSFACVAAGVAALWVISAFGGVRFPGEPASAGHSAWWGLFLLPYPLGWMAGLVGAIRVMREPVATTA